MRNIGGIEIPSWTRWKREVKNRVRGGKRVTPHTFPWVNRFIVKYKNEQLRHCTGTILTRR